MTPRNLVSDTCLISRPFNVRLGVGVKDGPMIELRVRDAVGLKYIKLHLLKLMWSRFQCTELSVY